MTPVRRGYHPPMTAARRAFALTFWTALSLALLGGSARSDRDPADQLHRFTAPVEFDFAGWTLGALGAKLGQDSIGEVGYLPEAERTELIRRYLDLVDRAGRLQGDLERLYADPAGCVDHVAARLDHRRASGARAGGRESTRAVGPGRSDRRHRHLPDDGRGDDGARLAGGGRRARMDPPHPHAASAGAGVRRLAGNANDERDDGQPDRQGLRASPDRALLPGAAAPATGGGSGSCRRDRIAR